MICITMLLDLIHGNILKNKYAPKPQIDITTLLNNYFPQVSCHNSQCLDTTAAMDVDCVYIITMNTTPIRTRYMQHMMSMFNMRCIFVQSYPVDKQDQFKYNMMYENYMSVGELGCLLSHLWVLDHAITCNYERFIVFEDDVMFRKGWIDDLQNIVHNVPCIDFLMLGVSDYNYAKANHQHVGQHYENVYVPDQSSTLRGSHAIMYSSDCAKYMFDKYIECPCGFDLKLIDTFECFPNTSFICSPNLCCCEQSTTSVNHETALFNSHEKKYFERCFQNNFNHNDYMFMYFHPLVNTTITSIPQNNSKHTTHTWHHVLDGTSVYSARHKKEILSRTDTTVFDSFALQYITGLPYAADCDDHDTSSSEDDTPVDDVDISSNTSSPFANLISYDNACADNVQSQPSVVFHSTRDTHAKNEFRSTCLEWLPFIRGTPLPHIELRRNLEAVFIEFRELPHIEAVIKNTMIKLGDQWSHTIICGTNNHNFIKTLFPLDLCVNIIVVQKQNITVDEYSTMLTSEGFWNLFYGSKVLIYQEDSWLFENNPMYMGACLTFDFVGAPFSELHDDTPNKVGNGGFSIRTPEVMKQVIRSTNIHGIKYSHYTKLYMETNGLKVPPEDVYFSKCMQELGIGAVATARVAQAFSSESVYCDHSIGGHAFWKSDKTWKTRLIDSIIPISTLRTYMDCSDIGVLAPKINRQNAIDIDLYFFRQAYPDIDLQSDDKCFQIFKEQHMSGMIFHPTQLRNMYMHDELFEIVQNIDDTIWIRQGVKIQPLDMVVKQLHAMSYDQIHGMCTRLVKRVNMESSDMLVIAYIGDVDIGKDLVQRVHTYHLREKCAVVFCVNMKISPAIVSHITSLGFTNMSIYESNEFGNDIVPSMLVYDDIVKSGLDYKYIMKLHTKRDNHMYADLTKYLLNTPHETIIDINQDYCACTGHPSYYRQLKYDKYNTELYKAYNNYIDMNKSFIEGSILCTTSKQMRFVLSFVQDHYQQILFSNMYDNNNVNKDASHVHFLERLFGVGIIMHDFELD